MSHGSGLRVGQGEAAQFEFQFEFLCASSPKCASISDGCKFDMNWHQNSKLSVTVHSDDRDVIGSMSALAHLCESEKPRPIYIEGQIGGNWELNGHHATFHFSSDAHRLDFIQLAHECFPNAWQIKDQRDNDPPFGSN
jgi:hypothetical protein